MSRKMSSNGIPIRTIVLILISSNHFAWGSIFCNLPAVNKYVYSNVGEGSVALIRENCAGLKNRDTSSWSKGISVKSNCISIPIGTAIATFQGSGGTEFDGGSFKNAAIFIGRCNSQGFYVFDQRLIDGKPVGVRSRVLRYRASGVDDGDNYYVID